jgi:hypothetical protein
VWQDDPVEGDAKGIGREKTALGRGERELSFSGFEILNVPPDTPTSSFMPCIGMVGKGR